MEVKKEEKATMRKIMKFSSCNKSRKWSKWKKNCMSWAKWL